MKDLFSIVVGSDEAEPEILARHLGFEGMLPVAWAAGGGILFGGFAVAVFTLMGRLSGAGLFVTAGALFLIGSAFGFVHGGILAYLGRDRDHSGTDFFASLARAVLFSIPVLAVAWAIAGWIALTDVAVYMARPLPIFGVGIGWILGLAVVTVAVAFGARGLRRSFDRWPEARSGTALVLLSFLALVVTFAFDRPDLWWTGRPVGMPGPLILAGGITVWLFGPAVTLSLRALRDLPDGGPPLLGRSVGGGALGALLGLGIGGVLGLLVHLTFGGYGVLPLALWSGTPGEAALVGLSQGLLDEVLLRLLVVVGLVWLVLRWKGTIGRGVVAAAVVTAALLHVLLYVPSLMNIGFPTLGAGLGYGVVAVLLPALVFGILFWWRGLAAAVLAHASMVAVAAVLAI